jgi:DNA helicase-2/ATP-dependent DNA helicase PcrA
MGAPEPLPEQRDFIEREPDAHALLVAGPGTGKTFTLERRAAFLVEQRGVDPERIALLTLTRSLVSSLAERVPYGRAQTLHSFALAQLNRLGDAWDRRVADPWEVENLVRTDLKLGFESAYDQRISRTRVGDFLDRLGSAFRANQDEPAAMSVEERRLFQVFQQQRELFRYRLMDELAYDLVRLLEQGAEIDDPPTHLLADEYQDFTAGELRLLQLLAATFGTAVDACGDDRQSIFGFRAADPLALHRFPAVYHVDHPDYLWRSSRCPQRVCDLANRMAETLPPLPGLERPALQPWEEREDEGVVELVAVSSPITEARWVVRRCRELVDVRRRPSELMVVVSAYFSDVFRYLTQAADEREGLPFSFYDPRRRDPLAGDLGVRLLSAGARLLVAADDQMAWRTLVWAAPGLGERRLERLLTAGEATFVANLRVTAGGDALSRRALEAGDALIEQLSGQAEVNPNAIVDLLSERLGCGAVDRTGVDAVRGELEAAPASEWLQRVVAVSEPTQVAPEEVPDAIPVYTIFGAKGLQAPVVFLMNALEQSFAGRGSLEDGVRRAYVGVTRASEHLLVSAPLYLRGSTLEHTVGTRAGGVAEVIAGSARQVGVVLQTVRAEDL